MIRQTLGTVLAQDYPHDALEIIVADGMSTDDTRSIVSEMRRDSPYPLYVIDNPGQIVPTGFNAALRQAKGEVIVRVDGHTRIEPDYVTRCVDDLERTGAENVGGKMVAEMTSGFGGAVALATSSFFGIGGATFRYADRETWADTVYLGAWPRRIFETIGLFDEEMVRNQDDEFNYRLLSSGGRIWLNPKIRSEYTSRGDPIKLWSQYYQYGYWKVRVLQKHPGQMKLRQFIPPVFVGALIVSAILALVVMPYGGLLLAMIKIAYLAANAIASLWTASQYGWKHLFYLPAVFAILHVSYGLGFLIGLIRFANRWADKNGQVPVLHDNPVPQFIIGERSR